MKRSNEHVFRAEVVPVSCDQQWTIDNGQAKLRVKEDNVVLHITVVGILIF